MEKLVISLGGSVFTDNPLRIGFIQKLAATVTNLREKFQIGIVVGGGTLARSYISAPILSASNAATVSVV